MGDTWRIQASFQVDKPDDQAQAGKGLLPLWENTCKFCQYLRYTPLEIVPIFLGCWWSWTSQHQQGQTLGQKAQEQVDKTFLFLPITPVIVPMQSTNCEAACPWGQSQYFLGK